MFELILILFVIAILSSVKVKPSRRSNGGKVKLPRAISKAMGKKRY